MHPFHIHSLFSVIHHVVRESVLRMYGLSEWHQIDRDYRQKKFLDSTIYNKVKPIYGFSNGISLRVLKYHMTSNDRSE